MLLILTEPLQRSPRILLAATAHEQPIMLLARALDPRVLLAPLLLRHELRLVRGEELRVQGLGLGFQGRDALRGGLARGVVHGGGGGGWRSEGGKMSG